MPSPPYLPAAESGAGWSRSKLGKRATIPPRRIRAAISCLAAASLVAAQVPGAYAATAMTRAEYEACQARDENGFRLAIEALTRKGLETGLANVDYKALVADEWRRGNIDDVIDREVDRAIGEVREASVDPLKGGARISTGQIITEGSEGLAGAVVLVVRRQLANMASRIGQRVVGSVLGRLVSVVAGGVGLVLIAKDIWDFRHGVLPIIATEMKSKETKDKVREELA